MTNGASTKRGNEMPSHKEAQQSSLNRTKCNCSVEVTSGKKSLAHTGRVTDEERRVCYPNKPTTGQSKQPRGASDQQLVLSHQMQDKYFFQNWEQ